MFLDAARTRGKKAAMAIDRIQDGKYGVHNAYVTFSVHFDRDEKGKAYL